MTDLPPADPTQSDAVPPETEFPNPDEFEDYDDVDSDTVVLPDDSFDETAVVDEEVND